MGVIDALLEDIIKKAASGSMSLVASSLGKLFSSMRPELNLEDETTQELIKRAESRRNQLPEEIVTDGRTYICIFDLKPPDLPVGPMQCMCLCLRLYTAMPPFAATYRPLMHPKYGMCLFSPLPPLPPLPPWQDKLKINQRVLLRGERVLASGETVEASHDWMSGEMIVIGAFPEFYEAYPYGCCLL